jgi:outer membrane protein OmpA-like peptidoglycan-associated protein
MRNRYLLSAGVAFAVALSWGSARAQMFAAPNEPGAWYFGGEGGWTSLESPQSGPVSGPGPLTRFREGFKTDGFNIGARAGYRWGPWRFEEEFRYQKNDLFSETTTAPIRAPGPINVTLPAKGSRYAYAIMSNVIYDFTLGFPLTPHIGGGIGPVIQRDAWSAGTLGTCARDNELEFGYQGIAGVRYDINPTLALDVDYRYLGTTDPVFHFGGGAASNNGFAKQTFRSGYSTHSVVASLTLRFGAAPPPVIAPPAPPAPPMAIRKVFLVFFDWDKDTITPEGMQIIQQAAAAFRSGAPVTIQVTGYTDRSGSPGYNQRLSERRANNVANALARVGVPRSQMAVSGRGENDNRVPTADGVREPQNRRVEIVFP